MKRENISSSTIWEEKVGYSRAVKVGNIIEVAGTTSTDGEVVIGKGNMYEQTKFIFLKIEHALIKANASLKDVVRTRMFVTDISKWEEASKAHYEFFKDIKPAATMVEVNKLINPDHLIEIEVTAIITD
ncbi:MAG TPA: RidA family protein [Bacteroidia bacterium]|nr:RidA family protein [Bacteroidia bacterium]HNU32679.1 RidA family protein [Bacteroidia bacterium]